MNTLLNSERDEDVEDTTRRPTYGKDREITLGTTLILGIFFALAVYGAVFFGFGYSMGAKHIAATATAAETNTGTVFNSFKPAPGSASGALAKPASGAALTVPFDSLPSTPPVPRASATAKAPVDAFEPNQPSAVPADKPSSKPASPTAASVLPAVGQPGAGQSMVQVAAVSHQEDADLLVTTLKRHGYNVAIRNEAQDKLLHVQIGPFATRKDADGIRQRLLADGFNAIIK